MSSELRTTDEVIDALGGTGPVADLVKGTPQQVSNWRRWNHFPARYADRLRSALATLRLKGSDSLWGME